MILIVGLGNPGERYETTRHNVGFMVLDRLLKKMTTVRDSVWEESKKFNAYLAKAGKDILLAKSQSYMNASGGPVAKIMTFYKIQPFGLYVIHDDVDLPLGKVKIAIDRGSAGHKGVESIMQMLGSKNFVRLRVGIGKDKKISADKFVLAPFTLLEKNRLNQAVKKAVEAMILILKEGVEKAAGKYNQ